MSQDPDVSTRMRASGRWAVGSLILVGLATSEISGLGTVIALPLAAINGFLSALCNGDIETYGLITKTPRKFRATRNSGDFFEFFGVWFDLLAQVAATATCARVVSATMDYMSGGRTSDWLFGYQSHSLGEPWPDILGIGIVLVLNLMFMLGLESSYTFFLILNMGVIGSLAFFLVLGCMYADLEFWKRDSFFPEGIVGMFTTAALCTFGFTDTFPEQEKKGRYRQPKTQTFLIILVQLLSYIGITMLFTLMSYFRELMGTAVPLVRMFEARDVDWARPIMASFTIVVVAIALIEFCPAMFDIILELSSDNWNVLTRALRYENETTGRTVLAIFTAGSLASILAFSCPISYLVRLLSAGPLLKHILHAMVIVYYRYQPEDDVEDFPVCNDVEYCRLSQGTKSERKLAHSSGIKARILTGSWFLPKSMRKSRSTMVKDIVVDRKSYKQSGKGGEESEYLLMGAYSPEPQDVSIRHSESNLDLETGSECSDGNDLTTITAHSTDSDESSTDIDAVVQEYKERLKVATTLTGPSVATVRLPSLATGRFVLGAIIGVCAWSTALAVGVLFEKVGIIGGAISGALVLTAMITAQPQVHLEHTFNQPVSCSLTDTFYSMHSCMIPVVPVIVIILNSILAAMVMGEIWLGILFWFGAGLVVFIKCEECCWCWDCVDPENSVHPLPTKCHRSESETILIDTTATLNPHSALVANIIPNHREGCTSATPIENNIRRFTHVDTILIAR